MKIKSLKVLIDDVAVGEVQRLQSGKLQFNYDEAYRKSLTAIPLSLSMPLAAPRHDNRAVSPFLWGLLPDNDDTLNHWGRQFGVSPRNPFALLSHIGEDLQGAVQMVPPESVDDLKKREGISYLSREVLAEKFADLMRHPGATQFTTEGGQFSLAGAQRKKALYRVSGKWYEPRGRTPTTHILKPQIPGLAGQIENEMFCVRLAPLMGLPAPKCWTEQFGDLTVVVIERYDRRRIAGKKILKIDQSGGTVHRVHQEDTCQALRVDPWNKYQRDGGPGMKAILDLLSGSHRPGEDRDRFMRACAYNFVIGGSDAHAKNYGLLLTSGGRFRLAPLYDIASWLPYSTNRKQDKLAMSVGGKYRFDHILPRHWVAEARKANYDPDRAVGHVRDLLAVLPDKAKFLRDRCASEGSATEDLNKLIKLVAKRCTSLKRVYGQEEMIEGQSELPGI